MRSSYNETNNLEMEKLKAYNDRYDCILALFENEKITFDQLKELIMINNNEMKRNFIS